MKNPERGVALVLIYLVVVLLMTLGSVYYALSLAEMRLAERYKNAQIAFHLSESGVDAAIAALKSDSSYSGVAYTALGAGGYDVAVASVAGHSTWRRITSNGYYPDNNTASRGYVRKTVEAYVDISTEEIVFNWSLFGDEKVKVTGSVVTDSYNSTNGLYIGTPPGTNGDVATNSISIGERGEDKAIYVNGSAVVNGDLIIGPGGDTSRAISIVGSSVVTGTRQAATSVVPTPSVTVPSGLTNSGALTVGSGTQTLAAGSYLYSSVSVANGATLTSSGPVKIYVTGDLNVDGGSILGSVNSPPNMIIKVVGDNDVRFSGTNNRLYAGLYAPDSDVTITGSATVYGGVIGEEVSLNGSGRFVLDEALSSAGASEQGITTIDVLSWREQ